MSRRPPALRPRLPSACVCITALHTFGISNSKLSCSPSFLQSWAGFSSFKRRHFYDVPSPALKLAEVPIFYYVSFKLFSWIPNPSPNQPYSQEGICYFLYNIRTISPMSWVLILIRTFSLLPIIWKTLVRCHFLLGILHHQFPWQNIPCPLNFSKEKPLKETRVPSHGEKLKHGQQGGAWQNCQVVSTSPPSPKKSGQVLMSSFPRADEVQRSWFICSKSQSSLVSEWGPNPTAYATGAWMGMIHGREGI